MPFETVQEKNKRQKNGCQYLKAQMVVHNQIWLSVGVIQAARKTGVKIHECYTGLQGLGMRPVPQTLWLIQSCAIAMFELINNLLLSSVL